MTHFCHNLTPPPPHQNPIVQARPPSPRSTNSLFLRHNLFRSPYKEAKEQTASTTIQAHVRKSAVTFRSYSFLHTNGYKGDPIPLRTGVDQGCATSPTLFISLLLRHALIQSPDKKAKERKASTIIQAHARKLAIILRSHRFGIDIKTGHRRTCSSGLPTMDNRAAYYAILTHHGNSKATSFLRNALSRGTPRKTAYPEALKILAEQLSTPPSYALPAPKADIHQSFRILLNLASEGTPLSQAPIQLRIFTMHPL